MNPRTPHTWLVTGAAGFLGRHLVRELIARGDRVRALVRGRPNPPLPAGAELVTGDVLARETLEPAMDGVDGVFHLAGRVAREGDADALYRLHVEGTVAVMQAMHAAGVRRIVLASSSGTVAVGTEPVAIGDDAPFAEVARAWPYYGSKMRQEAVARRLAGDLGLELVVLRPSLLLGPDDHHGSSTEDVRRAMRGELPVVPHGGVSFLDVRDCAATFARAMAVAPAGGTWLLGGANMTLRDFLVLVARVADVAPPALTVPDRAFELGVNALQLAGRFGWVTRPDKVAMEMARHYWYVDWSRAVGDLGHHPRPPTETVADTVAWLQRWEEPVDRPGTLLRLPWRARVS